MSRDVTFKKELPLHKTVNVLLVSTECQLETVQELKPSVEGVEQEEKNIVATVNAEDTDTSESENENDGSSIANRYGFRNRQQLKPPARLQDYALFATSPSSYTEAMASDDSAKWKEAIDEEIQSLIKNETKFSRFASGKKSDFK